MMNNLKNNMKSDILNNNNSEKDLNKPKDIEINLNNLNKKANDNNNKLLGILVMGSVTGASLLFGFSSALAMAKKRDTNAFNKGILMLSKSKSAESGVSLAIRALGLGSLYACTGFTIFCFTVWKVLGVNDLKEFRYKIGNLLPRISRNDSKNSRTEFSSLRDLFEYIIEESDKSHNKSNNNKNDK